MLLVFIQAACSTAGLSKPIGQIVEIESTSDSNAFKNKMKYHINCNGSHNGKSTILFEVGGGSSMIDAIGI